MLVSDLFATHNRAGEITYEQIGPLTIRMTITTYTKASSTAADRDSLEVFWGDGLKSWVRRSNGEGQLLDNDVKLNLYIQEHTYPGRNTYTISFLDPNRSGGILNINFPRSDDIKFYLSTRFTLLDFQFQGSNSSAQLLQPPIDIACVGQPFIHNPNAYDPDGDSLSYELIIPLQSEGQNVPGYFFPDQILPGPNNQIYLNPVTGDFIWQNPPQQGEYNIAMRINEWRSGVLINSIVRDMQIFVRVCNNQPPKIQTQEEYCVIAGTEIKIPLKISDPNVNQKVKLSVTGGPFNVPKNKALLIAPTGFNNIPFDGVITWKTTCNHINRTPYQIVVRALDNAIGDTSGLATLKSIRIKVVGPKPENVRAESVTDAIRVSWKSPYDCEVTDNKYFIGFSVWRRVQSRDIVIDTCSPPSLKNIYQKIVFNTNQKSGNEYFVIDKNVDPNTTYCYRVIAEFAQLSSTGNPFNKVESLPSDEVCMQLKRDLPMFTKVSVTQTSKATGAIELRWTKPLLRDFDTLQFKGPYVTQLIRKTPSGSSLVPAATKSSNFFASWIDTTFKDQNINTIDTNVTYELKFFTESTKESKKNKDASSVFLIVKPADKSNILSFVYSVPWANKSFNIYRKNDLGQFQLIGRTTKNTYEDKNLENGKNYCYVVEAVGTYSIKDIENPLFNLSQESCNIPNDNQPPCIPDLDLLTICDDEITSATEAINTLVISKGSCSNDEEVVSYNVYYKSTVDEEFKLIENIDGKRNKYQHQPSSISIAGCYAISALDKKGNESKKSPEICVNNCPVYELPNTFTPNNDGGNDVFKPLKNFFVDKVEFLLYNEWGNKIFETEDSFILWNGKDRDGNDYPTGTYYYTCKILVSSIKGIEENNLKGYINLLR